MYVEQTRAQNRQKKLCAQLATRLRFGVDIDSWQAEKLASGGGFRWLQPIFTEPVGLLGNADAAVIERPEIDQKQGDAMSAGRVDIDDRAYRTLKARLNPGLIHNVNAMYAAFIEPFWQLNLNGIANCKIAHCSPQSSTNSSCL